MNARNFCCGWSYKAYAINRMEFIHVFVWFGNLIKKLSDPNGQSGHKSHPALK